MDHNDENFHHQFCQLIGIIPSDKRAGVRISTTGPHSLYGRVLRRRRAQNCTYMFTATLSNTLLLTQVVLGAALTALGASESSHILITVFGAMNTVIAGMIAYLKSRGQPMRSRVFRDDLDRVVDEIENSEIMWMGITRNVHGYDEVAIDDSVSVRSEVARLTRLYDKAVRGNTMNDPDMYMGGSGTEGSSAALRSRPTPQSALAGPPAGPAAAAPAATSALDGHPSADEQGPASAPSKPKDSSPREGSPKPKDDPPKDTSKDDAPKVDATKDTPKAESSKDSTNGVEKAKEDEDAMHGDASKPAETSNDTKDSTPKADDATNHEDADTDDDDAAASTLVNTSTLDDKPKHDPDESPATRR